MIDKLDFLVRFWELRARNVSIGEPLAAHEQLELLSLWQLVTGDLEVPPPGVVGRPRSAVPAQLIGDGTILGVEVRSVTAAAIIVSCASRVPAGSNVILRATDVVSGVEYVLPCNVLWVHEAAPTILAMRVDGIPTREVFAEVPEPRMRLPLALGRHARMIG